MNTGASAPPVVGLCPLSSCWVGGDDGGMTTNIDDRPFVGRLKWTGYSALGILAFGPAIALFVLTVVGLPLVLVTAGILLLLVAVPLTGVLGNGFRAAAGWALGEPVTPAYRQPADAGLLPLLNCWARDPARWRDLLWLLWTMTFGFVLSMLVVTLLFAIAWYAVFPFLFAVTPDGVFDTNYGVFVIDTQAEAFFEWSWMVVAFGLWWWLAPLLGRAKARVDRWLLAPSRTEHLERRVQTLAETRAESVDFSAAELRRVERDLHDGAQARLVALGMSLGMAEKILDGDPDAAKQWLREARSTTTSALADLRTVVRGIHPPVLADRGLVGAVQALALDMPIPVLVTVSMAGRPPAPVETAAYFAIAECLANVGRHSSSQRAWVELTHTDGVLSVAVGDDGVGGASLDAGTGLAGVARRLAAFDGTLSVSSPPGGPTVIRMEVPCELSSPRTSPSSGTA